VDEVEGTITLRHNDKNVQTFQVPILKIDVEGQIWPSIGLAQNSLDFGQIERALLLTEEGA
tara:strand:- start:320 stop:502 length:183 start_codon:yes stop_codon:yes gene_type:complete